MELYLESLQLTQFKNYSAQKLVCSQQLNCLVGANGAGKTNLLEAIYYLCMGKSYFSTLDRYLIQHDTDFFRLHGQFRRAGKREDLVVKYQLNKRKVLERNGVAYQRIAEHVGRYPVVIIVPDDTDLIQEGSETRRRFLDNTLSQIDQQYLRQLLQYNRILKQRNALLKQYEGRKPPDSLLEVYDAQLAEPASFIYQRRHDFLQTFTRSLQRSYGAISAEREIVNCRYRSHLAERSIAEVLRERREKDLILQRTTGGIHRDELLFTMNDQPLRRVASQGQRKSFVLALKLAQYQILQEKQGLSPLLLLDDIFDKLDQQRVRQLLELILQKEYGQTFISDTDPGRVEALAEALQADFQSFQIADGAVLR